MLTFDEARQAVQDLEEPTWPGPGTYLVASWGRADATHFLIVTGASEDLIDHDPAYRRHDSPLWLVDRLTGTISWVSYLPGDRTAAKVDAMTPIGTPPGQRAA